MRKPGPVLALLLGTLILLAGCAQQQTQQDGNIVYTLGFIVIIFLVFYFLMVRPQRKRQKEHEKMVQELQKSDRVITAGGIYGIIESMDPESIVLKVESGATIRVARASVIGRRNPQPT